MTELKPCPFCGGPAKLIRPMGDRLYNRTEPPYYGEAKYRIVCAALYEEPIRHCPGQFPKDTEDDSITAWNTRADDVEIERLRALLGDIADIAFAAPELNPSNYDHDQVCQLNSAMTEIACMMPEGVRKALGDPS